jgi:hypothetical protein
MEHGLVTLVGTVSYQRPREEEEEEEEEEVEEDDEDEEGEISSSSRRDFCTKTLDLDPLPP